MASAYGWFARRGAPPVPFEIGTADGIGEGAGGCVTVFTKKSSADQPSIPVSKLTFHQLNPPELIGPPMTVPNAPVACVPRDVPLAVLRTLSGPEKTWTLSFMENLVEVIVVGVGVGVGVGVEVGVTTGIVPTVVPDKASEPQRLG